MSSILKVDTIQDQNGNLIISKDSGGGGFEGGSNGSMVVRMVQGHSLVV